MKHKKWLSVLLAAVMVLAMLPTAAFAEQAGVNGSSVVRIQDTESWYGDETQKYDTLDTYWNDEVTEKPGDYIVDEAAQTVSLGSAEALVWWSKQVNQEGTSFAGYTVELTGNIDLSAHYWTPICTGTVSYTSDGKYSIANNDTLDNTVIDGNGYTITGLTTQTGVRGPNQDSQPGDGQNCYYDAAFIGYSCCDITIEDLTFSGARMAISQPFEEVTQTYGSSMVAVVVGAQVGGSLTLNQVTVNNASVLAMQKASAFVANLMSGSTLTVNQCEISDSTFSAYFMVAPIVAYGTASQVTVNGIKLSNNTVQVVEQSSLSYTVDPDTGAEYESGYLNASTTTVFSDGTTQMGEGSELALVAEVDGYCYPTLAAAVEAVIQSADKTGTVTLLKDAQGAGIGLFNGKGATGVDLTIDFGGHTYTCMDPAVGSTGTESQGFHLERDNKVTLKNGTIAVSESSTKTQMLIQNYCDLTLENLTLKGAAVTGYIVSSNYGDITMTNVDIDGTAANLVAIDLMHWLGTGYADKAPTMVINNTSANTINGSIDVYCYGTDSSSCTSKPTMTINGGVYTVDPTDYLAQGCVATGVDGVYTVHTPEKTEAVAATCDTDGNIAYWYCADCGKYFSDAACTIEISLEDTVEPATGHHYVDGVCTGCGAQITTEVPTIDPTQPAQEVQVAVDQDSQAQLNGQAADILDAVTAGQETTAVSDETAQKIIEAVQQGQDITVAVEFDNTIQVSQTEQDLASAAAGTDGTIGAFFDLSIVFKAEGETLGHITELAKPMTFTVAIPSDLIQADRTFFIVRIHDGVAERLDTVMNQDNTLTFQSDKFSTYALGYVDKGSGETPGTGDGSDSGNNGDTTTPPQTGGSNNNGGQTSGAPQTGDQSNLVLWAVLLLAAVAGFVALALYGRKRNRG